MDHESSMKPERGKRGFGFFYFVSSTVADEIKSRHKNVVKASGSKQHMKGTFAPGPKLPIKTRRQKHAMLMPHAS